MFCSRNKIDVMEILKGKSPSGSLNRTGCGLRPERRILWEKIVFYSRNRPLTIVCDGGNNVYDQFWATTIQIFACHLGGEEN
jgi:hypothetical protein